MLSLNLHNQNLEEPTKVVDQLLNLILTVLPLAQNILFKGVDHTVAELNEALSQLNIVTVLHYVVDDVVNEMAVTILYEVLV